MLNTQIKSTPLTLAVIAFFLFLFLTMALLHAGFHAFPLETTTVVHPTTYQLPRVPGGISIRMAMLHDVLLDRYLPHGTAWNEQRIRRSRATIAQHTPSTQPAPNLPLLDAMDDLAVALENLHRSDEAAQVMRDKLRLLPPLSIGLPATPDLVNRVRPYDEQLTELIAFRHAADIYPETRHQYSARANLGTFLIHAAFPGTLAHDPAALKQLAEGQLLIQQSIVLNPAAHFGREKWQAIVVGHFLAAADTPSLLTDFDILGNRMTSIAAPAPRTARKLRYRDSLQTPAARLDQTLSSDERVAYRLGLPTTGIDLDWAEHVHPPITNPAPFDDPALALIGMWTLGGGPNPHAALALAHIAEQIGQYEIAFDGYQRALDLSPRFSPDASTRDTLSTHCQQRQSAIAALESPENPAAWETKTRQRHHDELNWAHTYLADYHTYEAAQIEKGLSPDDPHFYDDFFRSHPPIASPLGHADEVNVVILDPHPFLDALPLALLAAGIFSLLGTLPRKNRRT